MAAGGEAHSQEQLDSDVHRPAGAGQAQRACDRREGGTQAGLLPSLEHQAILHKVSQVSTCSCHAEQRPDTAPQRHVKLGLVEAACCTVLHCAEGNLYVSCSVIPFL